MTTVTPSAGGIAADMEAPALEDQGRGSEAEKRSPWWLYAVLGVGLLAMSLPFIWMLVSSVKPEAEVRRVPPTWLPESFTLENQTIARAAAIWRPLAPSQDALATDGLAFLSGLLSR